MSSTYDSNNFSLISLKSTIKKSCLHVADRWRVSCYLKLWRRYHRILWKGQESGSYLRRNLWDLWRTESFMPFLCNFNHHRFYFFWGKFETFIYAFVTSCLDYCYSLRWLTASTLLYFSLYKIMVLVFYIVLVNLYNLYNSRPSLVSYQTPPPFQNSLQNICSPIHHHVAESIPSLFILLFLSFCSILLYFPYMSDRPQ